MMKILFSLFLFPVLSFAAPTESFQGFIKINKDREVYVDWIYAQPGKPTAVLLNGLTYSTKQWDRFTKELTEHGIGVLRYDPYGMGETLLKYAPVQADIAIEDQAHDLNALLKILKVQKANLVGLSYGGGLGLVFASLYPEQVGNLILMAPYTEPLAAQDQWIKAQIWYTRQTQPWNNSTDDQLYAFFFRQIVYSTYPMAEPVVLQNPWILESVYRMGLGIRKMNISEIVVKLPASTVHLMVGAKDQYIPRHVLDAFWDKVPAKAKASRIVIQGAEHKIPESVPRFSAAWVAEVLSGNKAVQGGADFDGNPFSGLVKYKGGKIQLPKEF